MAKNANTYEKRRKEMERMRKAQEKREKRLARKEAAAANPEGAGGAPIVQPADLDDDLSVDTTANPEQSDDQSESTPQI